MNLTGRKLSTKARELQQKIPFVTQQPLFALYAPGIAGEGAVAPDHAMARHHNADGVRAICRTDRARRAGTAKLLCQLTVVHHLPAGNITQRLPHLALERGTRRGGWQGINNAEIALEVGRQFIAQPASYEQ